MNIVKNLMVPAIGLSFLLGGAVAFADDGGWGDTTANGDQGTSTDQQQDQGWNSSDADGTSTYLIGDKKGENDADGASTYLIGDKQDENDATASVQLAADENSGDTTDTDTTSTDEHSGWL